MKYDPAAFIAGGGAIDSHDRMASILAIAYSADNHDSLDGAILRLMLDLSKDDAPQPVIPSRRA